MVPDDFPIANKLLNSLPAQDLARLRPYLTRVPLKARRVLHHWSMPIEQVYFVEAGLVSVVARVDREHDVEVWIIGCEGFAGVPAILGAGTPPHRRVVQVDGHALCMTVTDLHQLMDRLPAFRDMLLRYVQAVLSQTSQVGACNGSHSLEHRLARWLLMARDRLSEELPLTHEMLSRMLGVRRASVTETVTTLEEIGALRKHRGSIHVVDGEKLEA